jgi:uncharacterized protein (TIGR02145 family)
MTISLVRNSGDEISIDISEIRTQYTEAIEAATSGITSGASSINISGELDDNGVLTLIWTDSQGEHSTQISGFLCPCEGSGNYHDETLQGKGTTTSPLGLSDIEKTGYYKSIKGIVEILPEQPSEGDRYVTKETISSFGRLYAKEGVNIIASELEDSMSPWRIATEEDWQKLIDYAEVYCEDEGSGLAGKVLKSIQYWDGNQNIDEYGFSVVPAGYVTHGMLEDEGTEARLWAGNDKSQSFSGNSDNTETLQATDGEWYSIRLVKDINLNGQRQSHATILGYEYEVVNITEIGLAWIKTNLAYKIQRYSQQYEYDYAGIEKESYFLKEWNGSNWISKPLHTGDKFSIVEGNTITDHTIITNQYGKTDILTSLKYTYNNETKKTTIDAGWY